MLFIEKKQRDCLECKMVPCFFCIYYKIIGKIENIDNLIKIKKCNVKIGVKQDK